MKFTRSISLTLFGALLLPVTVVSAEEKVPYSAIVVFGSSLSDSGNAFALLGTAATPPDYGLDPLLVPSAPYARGGHHLTNGATWIEQLARPLGLAGSVRPAFASQNPYAMNYAVGAARAYDDGKNFNLGDQVEAFLADVSGAAQPDALYAIEIGSNDIRDAIVAFQTGGVPAAQAVLQQALASVAGNIQALHRSGAREFLVWLAPNVALTPAIRQLELITPGISPLATVLTQSFNAGLNSVLMQLSALPGIRFHRLDTYTLLNAIVANAQAYGFANVTEACVRPNVAPFTCQRPDEYLFWDGIHPSRATHTIVATAAAQLLGW